MCCYALAAVLKKTASEKSEQEDSGADNVIAIRRIKRDICMTN